MDFIEQYYADHADEIQRDLLGRYAYAWASKRVQKLTRNLIKLDLLSAVGVALKLDEQETKSQTK